MATDRNRHPTTKSDLTPLKARLIELMQRINHGRIEGLHILDGEPQFDPPPRVIRQVKLDREEGPRPESGKADFALKADVVRLFAQLDAIGDGVVISIEVLHGLPFRMTFEEAYA
ncbi:MAG: hypothetical protein BWY92_00967 [Firmicutes bacterium ADurb.BinA052]|jgi:hypothetical protein|nr:MAG: hypothetical protein BWY92_00967 [Firmicutes bacterium ADurb.BinA052]